MSMAIRGFTIAGAQVAFIPLFWAFLLMFVGFGLRTAFKKWKEEHH
jgi:hypothetical protein